MDQNSEVKKGQCGHVKAKQSETFQIIPVLEKYILEMEKIPVIKDYYLVIGGGKVGKDFIEYAISRDYRAVLTIDMDERAPASEISRYIETEEELKSSIRSIADVQKMGELKNIMFYKSELQDVPAILSVGIPEYIIPAIPAHAAGYMLTHIKDIIMGAGQADNEIRLPQPARVEVRPDKIKGSIIESMIQQLPENIIRDVYPESGTIILSYAKQGEVCRDNCIGPEHYCPHFKREKPKTITEYSRGLSGYITGWVFESIQMKGGLGGILGEDLKKCCIEFIQLIRDREKKEKLNPAKKELDAEKEFFVATTCNCHGIMDIYRIESTTHD